MTPLGQEHLTKTLRDAARAGALHHAYLFVGPPGAGKVQAALWLAQIANCEAREEERPCDVCQACRLIAARSHPDVDWIGPDPESKKGHITIGQARSLRENIWHRPVMGRHKVIAMDPAHEMTLDAANALLKTIEEPPAFATLVLLAPDSSQVIPTILSRCQVIRFRPVPVGAIAAMLEAEGADPDTARQLAPLADGLPGEALRLLNDPRLREKRERALDWLDAVASAAFIDAPRLAHALRAGEGGIWPDIDETLRWADGWFRDILLAQAGAGEISFMHPDRAEDIGRAARRYPAPQARAAPALVRNARRFLAGNASVALVADNLVMDLIPHGDAP